MSEHIHPLYDCGGRGHGSDVSEVQWCHDCTPDRPANLLDLDSDEALAELAAALIGVTKPERHGQLCPVWTERFKRERRACDCYVGRQAPSRAAAILAALRAGREQA